MSISECISKRIRQIVKSKGITIYRLELLTGLSHSTMTCLLNCRYNSCNMKTVLLIIEALEMEISDFFCNELFSFQNLCMD